MTNKVEAIIKLKIDFTLFLLRLNSLSSAL